MLVELAIGDAYGAGFEYSSDKVVKTQNNLAAYIRHKSHNIEPGCYTDDTQMAIAIAELLVEGAPWSPELIAAKFVECYHRDPRDGYARGFKAFLDQTHDAATFLKNIRPDSDKSGAAMRAPPIGRLRNTGDVIDRTTVQARITHNTPDGISAACASALLTHYFAHNYGEKLSVGKFIEGQIGGQWSVPWTGKVGAPGLESVRAAVTAVTTSASLSQVLMNSIAFTGDVDTVASIAMAAASCSEQFVKDIPAHLISGLENGKFGREYIERLDKRLLGYH